MVGMDLPQEGGRDVVDRHAALGAALQRAVVGVAVDDRHHGIAIQGILQAAATEEGKDLDRFALDGRRGWARSGAPRSASRCGVGPGPTRA